VNLQWGSTRRNVAPQLLNIYKTKKREQTDRSRDDTVGDTVNAQPQGQDRKATTKKKQKRKNKKEETKKKRKKKKREYCSASAQVKSTVRRYIIKCRFSSLSMQAS
jgi:hypothetical protein